MRPRTVAVCIAMAALTGAMFADVSGVSAAPGAGARGARLSSVTRPEYRLGTAGISHVSAACSKPGGGNYMADCNSVGNPVNETSIANNGTTWVAGANDYNSYNGNADLGYYTSTDAQHWTDNGPLNLFPQGSNHAAGDPGLAIDPAGVVYYSSIYFDYFDCVIGGVELARRNPSNGTWSYYQILANSNTQFQDKPAVAIDSQRVYVSWTNYGGCFGATGPSPIKIALFPLGSNSVPPTARLSVPGSHFSQGSALAPDGHGGLWVTWEEFPTFTSTQGSIWLAHWRGRRLGWGAPMEISTPAFTDLPSPLPGFAFRDNSFPAIALAGGQPNVVWASYDTGVGRTYWWANGAVGAVSDTGGDQFFPSIAVNGAHEIGISWSQTGANSSFDQYLSVGGTTIKVSTASSFPNQDQVFGGTFIGDYNGMTGGPADSFNPIWTDLRRNNPLFGGKAQDAMVFAL